MKTSFYLFLLACMGILQGCKTYTSNIILKTKPEEQNWKSVYESLVVENPIKPGDKLQFSLYTNEGESIIDPSGTLVATKSFGDGTVSTPDKPTYEVLENGICLFPLIGKMQVSGLKTSQLDSVLSGLYEKYYNGVYVISKVINKKIIMLGGQGGQIIPFTTNMNLLEALAVYGGLPDNARGYNIRVIRGDLKNPEVKIVNLRTLADMKSSIVTLKPDDIIYIEPVRKPGSESVRDNLYILNIVQVLVTMSILFNQFITR